MLGNFPLSPRITTLLLARNRVSGVQPTIANSIPNLQNLVLASNNFTELADLDPLGGFSRLTHLVLIDNPVTKHEVRRPLCAPSELHTNARVLELPVLGHLEVPYGTVPGLPQGQGRGAEKGKGVVRHERRAVRPRHQGSSP